MEKKNRKKKNGEEPKRKAGFFARVAFFVFIFFCGVTVFQMMTQITERRREIVAAEKQIASFEAQIEALQDELAAPFDNTSVRKVARGKLNYSMPDDIVFYNDLSN